VTETGQPGIPALPGACSDRPFVTAAEITSNTGSAAVHPKNSAMYPVADVLLPNQCFAENLRQLPPDFHGV